MLTERCEPHLPKGCSVSLPDASAPLPIPALVPPLVNQTPVQSAIARAAAATGVDFNYLLAQAKLESGLDPSARARTSSARGLYQFTGSTWLRTLDRHGAELGYDTGGATHDPAARAHLLSLRGDPQLSALMAGELANDNRGYLYGVLGRDPDNAELYLAHFLGPDAAGRFLSALASDPGQSAAALLPRAAAANRVIFFAGSSARSVGQVMDLLRGRLDVAMQDGTTGTALPIASGGFAGNGLPLAATMPAAPAGGPLAREFAAAAAGPAAAVAASSMADTLQSAFGLADAGEGNGSGDAVTANVRAAYGRIRALGL
jgi:hypothetical protein